MKRLIRAAPYALFVLCLALIWTACSKNASNPGVIPPTDTTNHVTLPPPPPPPPPAVTAATLLSYKAWLYDTSGVDNNKDNVIDLGDPGSGPTSAIKLCQRDDSYTFLADSTGTMDGGTNKCTMGEAQTTPFTWFLSKDTTTLTATFNTVLNGGVTILKLDSTQLSVYKDTTVFGTPIRYIIKLKH
jgi:hypothetical protein